MRNILIFVLVSIVLGTLCVSAEASDVNDIAEVKFSVSTEALDKVNEHFYTNRSSRKKDLNDHYPFIYS